jgi:hypothetical protein
MESAHNISLHFMFLKARLRLGCLYSLNGKILPSKIMAAMQLSVHPKKGETSERKRVSEYLEESPFRLAARAAKVLRCYASGASPAKGVSGLRRERGESRTRKSLAAF